MNELIKIEQLYRKNNAYMQFTIYIIDICNYACYYCYNLQPRSLKQINIQYLIEYIEFLATSVKYDIEIEILGGEPTLHPDLYEFCKKIQTIRDGKINIIIYTNMSQTINYYKLFLEIPCVNFDFSYHSINLKPNTLYIKKIIALTNKRQYEKHKINITIMLEDKQELFDYAISISEVLDKLNISQYYNIEYRPLKYTNCDNWLPNYSKYQIDYFKEKVLPKCTKAFQLTYNNNIIKYFSFEELDINPQYTKFKNWKCNAGLDSLYCDVDGNIFKCESAGLEKKNPISNIYNKDTYIINMKHTVCEYNTCKIDNEVTKWR